MAVDVALDIGTAMTRLATPDGGVLFDEPTAVAIDTSDGAVVDVGYGALDMVGRTSRHVVVFRPLAQGATIDFDVTARLISGLFVRAGISKMSRARVVMSVPTLATAIERRALRQAAVQAGAKEVSLIEAPIAAAIGLGLPIQEPIGSAVAIFGAGACEAAVISLGGIVTGASRRLGGSDLDAAIAAQVRLEHQVVLSPHVIESIKIELASATNAEYAADVRVRGRRVKDGVASDVVVSTHSVNEAIADGLTSVMTMIQACLSDAPPDLSQDVIMRGLYLTGGLAQLHDVATFVATGAGVHVNLAPDPGRTIIEGLRLCLGEMRSLHALFRAADR